MKRQKLGRREKIEGEKLGRWEDERVKRQKLGSGKRKWEFFDCGLRILDCGIDKDLGMRAED